ncbi:hypothetical protein LY12_004655 [Prauserella alba]|nr:hypothetical protein [Prauserella alba]
MKAEEFDERFDRGEDVTGDLDLSAIRSVVAMARGDEAGLVGQGDEL